MKNLETLNPKGMRPSTFTSFAAMVSVAVGLICVPLALGGDQDTSLSKNMIAHFLLLVVGISLLLSIVSFIFRWGWKAKFFGFSMLFIGSISLLAVIPLLTILVFGILPGWIDALLVFVYIVTHIWWCRKFVVLYKNIFDDLKMRAILYEEDVDAVYYKRKGDKLLLEKFFNFTQMPSDKNFLAFIALGLGLIPFAGQVKLITGMPFAHVFLTVAMLPVSWMSVGLAVRGFLVCYYYPAKMKAITGKDVYVDLTGGIGKNSVPLNDEVTTKK